MLHLEISLFRNLRYAQAPLFVPWQHLLYLSSATLGKEIEEYVSLSVWVNFSFKGTKPFQTAWERGAGRRKAKTLLKSSPPPAGKVPPLLPVMQGPGRCTQSFRGGVLLPLEFLCWLHLLIALSPLTTQALQLPFPLSLIVPLKLLLPLAGKRPNHEGSSMALLVSS